MNKLILGKASKINGTPKGVFLPMSKLTSILARENLLALNNISQLIFFTAVKFHYKVLQLTAVFWQSEIIGGNVYFAGDGTFILEYNQDAIFPFFLLV